MCRIICLTLAVFFASSLSLTAYAQTAQFQGRVTDPQQAVVAGAEIRIFNQATGVERKVKTNNEGLYTAPFVQPGTYQIYVQAPGFSTVSSAPLTVTVGQSLVFDVQLKVGTASQEVTVNGGSQILNTTDASVSTVIDRNFVANMPLNGRSFQDLLTLAPGVTQVPVNATGGTGVGYSGEIVVNGQRTEANYFTVDGVSANTGAQPGITSGNAGFAGSVPGETALGSTQSLVSIDDLQEFRATTSTYSAEYGRTPGGQFSFTTRSGTSHLHGTAYDYLRNDAMDATNWFNNYLDKPKGEERQNDFGGTLGGPVLLPHFYNGKERTFFFVSYEGLRLDSPQAATQIEVPDIALRQNAPSAVQPLLNAWPVPNGGEDGQNDGLAYYIQATSFPAQLDNTSIRVDHHLSANWNIFGRWAYTPSSNTTYSGAISNSTKTNNQGVTLGSTNTFGSHKSNDLRFNFTDNSFHLDATSTDVGGAQPFNQNTLPGFGNGNSGELVAYFVYGLYPDITLKTTSSDQKQFNITDAYNWQIGPHNIRLGVDWRRLQTGYLPTTPIEDIYFYSASEVLSNNASGGAAAQPQGILKPVYMNFSTFLQDEWRATSRLSLSLGVRWDINPAPGDAAGHLPYTLTQVTNLASATLAPKGTPLWNTDWHGIAPRLGFAYRLHQSPGRETVLRTGFGMFYDLGTVLGAGGYSGIGYSTSAFYSSVSFPLPASLVTLPPPSVAVPYTGGVIYAFDPNLRLPYSMQYNLSLEQALTPSQTVTFAYVGSAGRDLLTNFIHYPYDLGNANFAPSTSAYITSNGASSAYNSLQVKYQRSLTRGLQALISYTWSHSIDDASENALLYTLLRASSDFDIRNQFQAAITYAVPTFRASRVVTALAGNWGLDLRLQSRSSLPINILSPAVIDPSTGLSYEYQPNFVPNEPVYLRGESYPGKRIINFAAFESAPALTQGNVPRNYARGFDAVQADIAAHRTFPIHESFNLQFRAEAFNLFNHPQFGSVYNELSDGSALFGRAYNMLNNQLGGLNPLYQIGGPRSLQVMLRAAF